MKQRSKFAIGAVLALSLATVAFTAGKSGRTEASPGVVANATNAAYRDGLYVGQRAAEAGKNPARATSRWVEQQDRDSFSAGYAEGYNQAASR